MSDLFCWRVADESLRMTKKNSRVAHQARDAKAQAAEIEKKIRQLSSHIANPQKYLTPRPDARTQSTVERFRQYFNLDSAGAVPKRKPTRAELRGQRTRAIVWATIAFFVLAWMIGKFWRAFR